LIGTVNLSLIIIIFSLSFAFAGLVLRVIRLLANPVASDPSPPKASARKGIVYAFMTGMLPWKKESAKLHLLTYLRGILFHIGVFTAIILLLVSLFVDLIQFRWSIAFGPILGIGFLAGVIALVSRLTDRNLRAINRLDDYISLGLVILVQLAGLLYVLTAMSRTFFWGIFSVLLLYLPWSKIPHVIYFFFSRTVFGTMIGRRGILPVPKSGH
jgi:nitrate reductase gamma subunit